MIPNRFKLLLLTSTITINTVVGIDVSNKDLPLSIEVAQEVQIKKSTDGNWTQRGTLYANTDMKIEKGQSFQMIEIGGEGGCRIRFRGVEYNIFSCPWLPGFRDHQEDIFVLLTVNSF